MLILRDLTNGIGLRYVFLCSPSPWEMIHFHEHMFSDGLKLSPSQPFVALDAFVASLEVLYEQSIQGFGFRSKER